MIKGDDVVDEIARYAENHNVTKIVLGKPMRFGLFPSLAQNIMARTKGIDILLFAGRKDEQPLPKKKIAFVFHFHHYILSFLAVGCISMIGFFLRDMLGQTNIVFLQLLPVILIALFLGRGPSIFAAIISILVFDYVFVPPFYTFAISDVKYFVTFTVYLVVVVVISNLASNQRHKVKQVRQSESRSTALYGLSHDLVTAQNIDQILSILVSHAKQIFQCEVAIFLPTNGELSVRATTTGFQIDTKEIGVAKWVWTNGKSAGLGTSTLPQAWAYYLPMITTDKVKGIIGFHFENHEHVMTPDNQVVLETIANLGALAIERVGFQT